MNQNKCLVNEWFFFISSTDNNRLSELEIELENLKIQTEELQTKLQCFEENKRLRKSLEKLRSRWAVDPENVSQSDVKCSSLSGYLYL